MTHHCRRIIIGIAALFAASGLYSCKKRSSKADNTVKYASEYSGALDARVKDAVMYTKTADPEKWGPEVMEQLRFMTGILHGVDGGMDLLNSKLQVDNERSARTPNAAGLYEVHYSLGALVSYPKNQPMYQRLAANWANPNYFESLQMILPKRGDDSGLEEFANAHQEKCHMPGFGESVASYKYWFYYRPKAEGCVMKPELIVTTTMSLQYSQENTYNRTPDYSKIYAPTKNKVAATLVFTDYGTEVEGMDWSDKVMIDFFKTTVTTITGWFGAPKVSVDGKENAEMSRGATPKPGHQVIVVTWKWPQTRYEVELRIFRLSALNDIDPPGTESGSSAERSRTFNESLRDSDFISYNGHSSYGANSKLLLHELGNFTSGRYYIFLLNACNTFNDVGPQLRERFLKLNPGAQQAEDFYDVLSNATPGYGTYFAEVNDAVIQGLLYRKSYAEILKKMPAAMQQVVLVGEKTNPQTPPSAPQ